MQQIPLKTTKEQLEFLKNKDRKVHCIHKNLVNVPMNMSATLCHAFMNDKIVDKLAPIELLSNFSSNSNVNATDDVANPNANANNNDDKKN
jgi:hypothetical protein